ncbi:hypothetical protein E3U43_019879 [Larimichthys crocea]|uniref:Uncharacterized protein n=1 Tax=Larimichthys crocea TaxID=215358 RepID=A0ACD3QUG8_LARCR|nr:hypothetical protein E3U43_019879 [Larimichthys crocea]
MDPNHSPRSQLRCSHATQTSSSSNAIKESPCSNFLQKTASNFPAKQSQMHVVASLPSEVEPMQIHPSSSSSLVAKSTQKDPLWKALHFCFDLARAYKHHHHLLKL